MALYAVCYSGFALPLLLTLTDLEISQALTDKPLRLQIGLPVIKSLQDLRDENYGQCITAYLALQQYELHKASAAEDELVALVMAEPTLSPKPERFARVVNMVETMEQYFGSCTNHGECEKACPKEISIDFIALLNRTT